MSTKCRHCGSSSYGHSCIYGPEKIHEHIDDEKHCDGRRRERKQEGVVLGRQTVNWMILLAVSGIVGLAILEK